MKANEAPEKIFLHPDICSREFIRSWLKTRVNQESVEYTQTDAFIEKACKFISDRIDIPFNVECSNGEPLADSYSKYASARLEAANRIIDEFRKYMKGEKV